MDIERKNTYRLKEKVLIKLKYFSTTKNLYLFPVSVSFRFLSERINYSVNNKKLTIIYNKPPLFIRVLSNI